MRICRDAQRHFREVIRNVYAVPVPQWQLIVVHNFSVSNQARISPVHNILRTIRDSFGVATLIVGVFPDFATSFHVSGHTLLVCIVYIWIVQWFQCCRRILNRTRNC